MATSAPSIIAACHEQLQHLPTRWRMVVTSNYRSLLPLFEPIRLAHRMVLIRDGERADFTDTQTVLNLDEAPAAHMLRMYQCERRYISHESSTGRAMRIERAHDGSIDCTVGEAGFDRRVCLPWASLGAQAYVLGHLGRDDRPWPQALAAARKASLRPAVESVEGHACTVLEATTPRGRHTLWCDPAIGWMPRRARVDQPAPVEDHDHGGAGDSAAVDAADTNRREHDASEFLIWDLTCHDMMPIAGTWLPRHFTLVREQHQALQPQRCGQPPVRQSDPGPSGCLVDGQCWEARVEAFEELDGPLPPGAFLASLPEGTVGADALERGATWLWEQGRLRPGPKRS